MNKLIYKTMIIGGLTIEIASAVYLGKEIIKYGFSDNKNRIEYDEKDKKNINLAGIGLIGGVVISMIPTFTSPKEFEKKEENELEEILK
jgi:predicted histidine transporter YuiF (NhaC family)